MKKFVIPNRSEESHTKRIRTKQLYEIPRFTRDDKKSILSNFMLYFKNHKKLITAFCLLSFIFLFVLLPTVQAQFGLDDTAEKAGLIKKGVAAPGPAAFVGTLVGYALTFIGVVFFVLMVYGGFLWMQARGNEEHIKKAKGLIEAAIIGMVIVFLAYTLTNFILGRLLEGAGIVTTPAS